MRIDRVASFVLGSFILFSSHFLSAQNPIIEENSKPGNPSTEWDVVGSGDQTIQGYATDISVNKGGTVRFKVNITGTNKNFSIRIYRIGYYQGNGARFITSIGPIAGVTQPSPITNTSLGLVDCGNWSQSASWAVPATAVSGVYIARLIRADNGGASHIVFIVRDDQTPSDILFKTSDATWQAYNVYGGTSLYTGSTAFGNGHAVKVSYNRPFITRAGGGGGGAAEDWLFNAEYPMIRWLERNGYNVEYTTDLDMERLATPITPDRCKVLLSVGHDEYWSANERFRFEEARDNGVHLAFFSGNEVYWKTRWENSIDGTNTPYRTLVCYKEGTLGENVCNTECDPSSNWTGLWRSGCGATAIDACKPENALTGQISWDLYTGSIVVPALYKNHRFWRNTSITSLTASQSATLPNGTLGYETDFEQAAYLTSYPYGRITLSSTTYNGKVHKLSLYRHPSGALVFGAGTVQWSWGLDDKHDRGNAAPSPIMQQATVNLFADMGVQPGTLQSGLVAATASSDIDPPVSVISVPSSGSNFSSGTPVVISGTSTDANVVAGVEISFDGGLTWVVANGSTNWTYTWTPIATGTYNIRVRGFDDSGNMEDPGAAPASNSITVTVDQQQCPCSIWSPTVVPGTIAEADNQAVELGVKFRSYINGFIKGIRYYKSSTNTGTHIGNLWTSTGTNLARATFTNETSTGWQEVIFSKPVAITAGVTYVASYFTPTGHYSSDENYFSTKGTVTPSLVALQNGVDGPNGIYSYSSTTVFPVNTFNSSNYYVDVVFTNTLGPDTISPKIIGTNPANNTPNVEVTTAVNITFNEAIKTTTVSSATIELRRDSDNVLVSSAITYVAGSKTAIVTPSVALEYNTRYRVLIRGGSTGTVITDTAGNKLEKDSIFRFTTKVRPALPSDGPGGPILVIGSASNPFSFYAAEMLRAEGFNAFASTDINAVNAALLNKYDVVIVGEIPLTATNITDLANWTTAGGTLISFRPTTGLYPLLGITAATGTLAEGYLLVNGATDEGKGIVQTTIQYHGTANYVNLGTATSLARLYSTATAATTFPAITRNVVGSSGGMAYAFLYDLPRSVVYTRQGNPAWAGQKRDGTSGPIRSDDLFYPDWVNLNKVAIPQADEQLHLMSNMIHFATIDRKPLPRIWFLPKGLKAAVVMTGDDHASNGTSTVSRFNRYRNQSPSNTDDAIANWEAVRATSYIYPTTLITNDEVIQAQRDGFEVGLHLNTGCANFTPTSWSTDWNNQYTQIKSLLPGMLDQTTHRTHCIAWSDYSTQAKKQAALGVRLDVNYYYWPDKWVLNRPGLFTGSGLPMRFSDVDGTLIDCYQVTTQLTDESGMDLAFHIRSLLDSALGTSGYYSVICANMHTDNVPVQALPGSDIIVEEALARNVPVISSRQLLDWIDGRNGSTFTNLRWSGDTLSFNITAATGSRNMRAMLPLYSNNKMLSVIRYSGGTLSTTADIIKGIPYVFFDATLGAASYEAIYGAPQTPVISDVKAVVTGSNTATITWNTNIYADSRVDFGTVKNTLSGNKSIPSISREHEVKLTNLTPGSVYYFRVTSREYLNNSATSPTASQDPLVFVTWAAPCAIDTSSAQFSSGTVDSNTVVSLMTKGSVILKPAILDEFTGTTLNSSNWTNASYVTGGTTVVSGGQATVSGTHFYSRSAYGPGTRIEFEATFRSSVNQGIGFSANRNFTTTPWVVIGQGATADGNLYVRTSDNKVYNLGPSFIGTPHRYAIQWNTPANTFSFYADGKLIAASNITLAVASNMYIQVSDRDTTGGKLSVNWFRVMPYKTSGTFTSRVFDNGISAVWTDLEWASLTPNNSFISFQARGGNTAIPDATWTTFANFAMGDTLNFNRRYMQYRAVLNTTSPSFTPELYQVSVGCKDANSVITISQQPVSVEQCEGTFATFVSKATSGKPTIVQWQSSEDGVNWVDITGQNKDTLRLLMSSQNNGLRYRASWINGFETKVSSVATATIRKVLLSVGSQSNISCFGVQDGLVSLTVSGGTSPYQYSKNGGVLQSGNIFSGLAKGTYVFSTRDAFGCTDDTTIVITEPNQLVTTVTAKTDVACKGGNTGLITVASTGGTAPYQYNINSSAFQSSGTFSSLTAGNYTIGIRDAKACVSSIPVTIVEPAVLVSAPTTVINANCNGTSTGSVTLGATGGTTPYQFRMNGGTLQSATVFSGLAKGTYVFTVVDAKGCTDDTTVNISEPAILGINLVSKVNVTCKGSSNGSFSVSATGGTSPYQFNINGGAYQSAAVFSNLVAGSYLVGVRDAKGCITQINVVVSEPQTLLLQTASVTNISCNGGQNGSVNLSATGGTSPYQYSINSGIYQSSNIFGNLAKGTYLITVKDANGCTDDTSLVVAEPLKLSASLVEKSDITCKGGNNGTITVSAAGGVTPYQYNVNNGSYQGNAVFSGLLANSYIVGVKDANGCLASVGVSLVEPTAVIAAPVTIVNANCNGSATGSVTLTSTGGVAPYQFRMNGGALQSANIFSSLVKGTYVFTAVDANGCSDDTTISVTEPPLLRLNLLAKVNVSCYGNVNGSISVSATGGTSPYQFSINSGAYQTLSTFSNLAAGNYAVTVRDAKGCIAQLVVEISEPQALTLQPVSISNISCSGLQNGSVILSATGGTASFQYSINEGVYQSGSVYSGLAKGSYLFKVRDANGCVDDTTITISAPDPLVVSGVVKNDVTCKGTATGSITIVLTGGTQPFTYNLNGGADRSSPVFDSLTAGQYTIKVIDNRGCSTTSVVTISEPEILSVSAVNIVDNTCYGYRAGSFNVLALGGVTPYKYSIDSGRSYTDSAAFRSLAAGSYQVSVMDNNGCLANTGISISEPAPLLASVTAGYLDCMEDVTGTFSVSVSGGVGPWQIFYGSGLNVPSQAAAVSNLPAGDYPIQIIDANNCKKDTSVRIEVEKAIWLGTASNDWHDPANWSTNKVPSQRTHVIIPTGTPNECVLSLADATLSSLQIKDNAPLIILNDRKIEIKGTCLVLPSN